MKKQFILIVMPLFLANLSVYSQGNFDTVLTSIEANNLTLQLVKQEGEAQNLHNSTGLTLENPQINYDYMIGSPSGAGNQTDIVVSQSFDFPSVYARKKQVSVEMNKMASLNYQGERLHVLFTAKQICMDQIYRNKLNSQYTQRKQSLEKLTVNYKTKMDKGEGTILEVNKAQLQLIELNKVMELNQSMIRQNNEKLSGLNGGIPIALTDTTYPNLPISTSFEIYMSELKEKDPYLMMIDQQNEIAKKQVELSKAISLPKFELGYHYQGILGQRFNGAHAAMTIPLWENKNVVKAAQASSTTLELEKQNYENVRYYELKNTFEKYLTLKNTLVQYESVFTTFSNTELLLKALNFGEISTIEYFMELSYYYTNYDNYLQTEKELNQTIIELMKFN